MLVSSLVKCSICPHQFSVFLVCALDHTSNAFAFGSSVVLRKEHTYTRDCWIDLNMVAEHIMNVLIPLIVEEIVEVIKVVLRERISERVREQIVDVRVPRAVEQVTEVAKTKEISVLAETIEEKMVRVETLAVEVEKMRSELFEAERAMLANPFAKVKGLITCLISRLQVEALSEMSDTSYCDEGTSQATKMKDDLEADTAKHSSLIETAVSRSSLFGEVPSRDQILQCTVEQVLDVPVPEMVEVPKTISQDKIQQRIVEQIIDVPVPQVVKELVEVSKVFPQDRVQQCFTEQTIETPAISLEVKITEAPVIQTHEETQQLVNTHVQHVVNTVQVEEPKLIKETVQRKKAIDQEKINQVTKHIDVPQVQFLDKADDMPVVVQRQVYMTPEIQRSPGRSELRKFGHCAYSPAGTSGNCGGGRDRRRCGGCTGPRHRQDHGCVSYFDAETSSHRTDCFERSEWSVRRETHERGSGDRWNGQDFQD